MEEKPSFYDYSRQLNRFLVEVCKELSNGDVKFLESLRKPKESFDQLELTESCLVLFNAAEGFRDYSRDDCDLFGTHKIDKPTVNAISFTIGLRNKYYHDKAYQNFDSMERLADLILVRNMVVSLSKLCQNSIPDFLSLLERDIKKLVVQVAEVTDPEKFDRGGEVNVLSESDHGLLAEVFRGIVREAFAAAAPINTVMSEMTEVVSSPINDISVIQNQLAQIEKKLAPLKLLKGQMDNVEMSIVSQISNLQSVVSEIYVDLREDYFGAVANSESQIEDYDDRDEGDIGEDDYENSRPDNVSENLKLVFDKLTATPLTRWQARDELITLRKHIWSETNSGPSYTGLLRKTMIDEFLECLPLSEEEAWNGQMKWRLKSVDEYQLRFLPAVCFILGRVDTSYRPPWMGTPGKAVLRIN